MRETQRGQHIAQAGTARGKYFLHDIHNTYTTNPTNSNLITLLASQLPVNELVFGDTLQTKQGGHTRLVFEKFNRFVPWDTHNDKIIIARNSLHKVNADCYTVAETHVQ